MPLEDRIGELLDRMTLEEKIGQMSQVNGATEGLEGAIAAGRVGSVLNEASFERVQQLQRIAVEESRLGIPLLIGRDVIHGFRTIFPIPLGQAASFNRDLVEAAARISALEAASSGINWTFAPMIDITRDPRWGRIAESLGEDTYLCSELGAAMVRGFQGEDFSQAGNIAATAKHFAAYGATESGRDYNTANVPENELRNVYLPPFKAALDAGVASFMTSFSDLNGVPASGNEFLLKQVLRDEWGFQGLVVSDWNSIQQLADHGFTANDRESAFEAANAGVDMEMASTTYAEHLAGLIEAGRLEEGQIDTMVGNILRIKLQLGLFERPYPDRDALPPLLAESHREAAKLAAMQGSVLLKNDARVLPIAADKLARLAVIGPLADAPYEQLGTWIFDGNPADSITPLQALRELAGDDFQLHYVKALENSRARSSDNFAEAVAAAALADVALLFLGEESILSGEAHSRADIDLPGDQPGLVQAVAATGTPVVLVVLAGRPLTLANVLDQVDALLYAWHPGTMAGPAIADLLFGKDSPSGKLPVSFPRMVGQVPVYYAHKNTGRPPSDESIVHIDDIDPQAPQTSLGMSAFFLDAGFRPLFPFGFGLSYTDFEYRELRLSASELRAQESLTVSVELVNVGQREAEEVAQLYVRDLVGNVTRPVRELKGFQRLRLAPGESRTVSFTLAADDLAFHDRRMRRIVEPGDFHVWVGGSSEASLQAQFRLIDSP